MSSRASWMSRWRGTPRTIGDYVLLAKPRVTLLLLYTTLAGMIAAGQRVPGPSMLALTLGGGALVAGGAAAMNCCLDRDVDAVMDRTCHRPLAARRLSARKGWAVGLSLSGLGLITLWWGVNPLAAGLALVGHLYYVLVYTLWLKRRSRHNIVVGGVAGAIPPLVGWAAATGTLSAEAAVPFLIVLLWTPPHFWALALLRKDEYARAGIPMLPVQIGERATRDAILRYSAALVAASLLPAATPFLGATYLVAALALGALLLRHAIALRMFGSRADARLLYRYSMLYLALLFGVMAVDRVMFCA